jgi:EAL domain-containing protein (putative c-di-GMP-specific phosphodiesterase class I)
VFDEWRDKSEAEKTKLKALITRLKEQGTRIVAEWMTRDKLALARTIGCDLFQGRSLEASDFS